jgi:hypothetical protein
MIDDFGSGFETLSDEACLVLLLADLTFEFSPWPNSPKTTNRLASKIWKADVFF